MQNDTFTYVDWSCLKLVLAASGMWMVLNHTLSLCTRSEMSIFYMYI